MANIQTFIIHVLFGKNNAIINFSQSLMQKNEKLQKKNAS